MIRAGRARATVGRALRVLGLEQIAEARARRFFGEAALWVPEHLVVSGWLEHAPFAFWLLGATRPTRVVELGTESGFSYLVFCQAIREHGLPARAYAIDTWGGDEHTGLYGDDVFTRLRSIHDPAYGDFSTLVRAPFSDALASFADGSIDLLHVDGFHTYDAVRNDFESWRPKLSHRAMVLFHDTNVHAQGFGVHRYWQEIHSQFPSFEFLHGNGLGLLVVGSNAPSMALELGETRRRPRVVAAIRRRYEALGADIAALEEARARETGPA